jgi:hypothetical protein
MQGFKLAPLALSLILAACGGPDFAVNGRELPEPDDPGFYVLASDGDLRRIDGSPEWERQTWAQRSDLAPDIEFIVLDNSLAGATAGRAVPVRMSRVAWLRSELEPTGQAAPAAGSQWVATGLEAFDEPVVATPHPRIAGLFHLQPAAPLQPGLYEISLDTGSLRRARIGVLWNATDKRVYSAAHCVDRVLDYTTRFQRCADSGAAQAQYVAAPAPAVPQPPSPLGLQISLDKPLKESGGLTITGNIVNTSGSTQRLPELQGQILDASGQVIDSWLFTAPSGVMQPGESTQFSTWRPSPNGAARLNVDFVG